MQLPKYKSNHRLTWDEICTDFPDIANQIAQENSWSQFEQKPDLSDVDTDLLKWIPEGVREGKSEERIDTIILTK